MHLILTRRNDKISDVRCAWTEYCLPLYINHHELAKQINGMKVKTYLLRCYLLLFRIATPPWRYMGANVVERDLFNLFLELLELYGIFVNS